MAMNLSTVVRKTNNELDGVRVFPQRWRNSHRPLSEPSNNFLKVLARRSAEGGIHFSLVCTWESPRFKNLMRSLEPRPPTVKRKGNVSLTEGDLGRRLFEKASIKTTKVDYKKNTSIMTNLTYICVRVMAMLAGKISCANLSGLYALNDH